MTTAERIKKFKTTAETIADKVKFIPIEVLDQEQWVTNELIDCIRKLEIHTKQVIDQASSPLKIGVVGEFGAGKKLLNGSLIGYADALPVSELPAMGNITAIHLVQQEDLQTTKFGNTVTVEYLDEHQVNECLEYMLVEVKVRATKAGLDPNTISHYPNIIDWCKWAWNKSQNRELRCLIQELVEFVYAFKSYGKVLCGKRNEKIDAKIAKEGLEIDGFSANTQSFKSEALLSTLAPLVEEPKFFTAQLLKSSFPLIRRIELEVKISKEIWDLTNLLAVNELIMLDFPGLGYENCRVRDTWLYVKELAEVQTILILLNGKRPGADETNKILNILEQHKGADIKDSIIVGVGRFDELPIQYDGGLKILDELSKQEFELTEKTIFEQFKILQTVIDNAQVFTTRKDRILFLSPILSLANLTEHSTKITVASDAFFSNLNYLQQSIDIAKKWGILSNKLRKSKPKSILARQLSDFAADGGIGRLKEVILNHVATHSLKQLEADTEKFYNALIQEKQRLQKILGDIETHGISIEKYPILVALKDTVRISAAHDSYQDNLVKKPLQNPRSSNVNTDISTLLNSLTAKDTQTRSQAALALGKLGSEDAVPALSHALITDQAPEVRRSAAKALGMIGSADSEAKG